MQLRVCLAPLALAALLALALSRVTQLVHQASFLVFGEGTGDLAHHLAAGVLARRQIVAAGG